MKNATDPTITGYLCRIAGGLLLLSALGACGYKGPLYMPKPSPPPESLTKPPTPQPLPSETPPSTPASPGAATSSAVK
ncbi:MAG TPA: lipoprotein [Burkholderiaceae bacterium]|nr:lipoprotein [Burkholderiaceae bacterium]